MSFTEHNENGLIYMTSDVIGAKHAFTTRYGGVSEGYFSSLNLGSNRGDSPENVRENYRRVCALMGADTDGCAVTNQVHKNAVRTVKRSDRHICLSHVPYEADGIVTAEKGLPIFCFTADCVPVLLWDRYDRAIGAVHCGWRSSVADILKNALKAMEALGAEREDICAAIGPAIDFCCFEVGEDVVLALWSYLSGDTDGLIKEKGGGKYLADLKNANRRRLIQLGVPEDNIDVSRECTFCLHDKYWSHRYTHGQRGSQASCIVLE